MTEEEKAKAEQERREKEDRERQESEELSKKSQAELVEYAKSLRQQNKALRTERDNLRTERETVVKERDDFKSKIEEREKKDLEDQKNFQELAKREKERADKIEQDYKAKLEAESQNSIREAVRAAAIRAGIHDPRDVDTMDIKDLRRTEDGSIAGLDEFISARKGEKPHWFKADGSPNPAPPAPPRAVPTDNKTGTDWSKAAEADFDRQLSTMMSRV